MIAASLHVAIEASAPCSAWGDYGSLVTPIFTDRRQATNTAATAAAAAGALSCARRVDMDINGHLPLWT